MAKMANKAPEVLRKRTFLSSSASSSVVTMSDEV